MDEIKSFEFKVKNKKFKCQKTEEGNYIITPFIETISLDLIIQGIQKQTHFKEVKITVIIPQKIPNINFMKNASKYYLATLK